MAALVFVAAMAALGSSEAHGAQLGWGYKAASAGEPSMLLYGVEGGDTMVMGFECSPGSGRVRILMFSNDPKKQSVRATLQSGDVGRKYDLALAHAEGADDFSGWRTDTSAADPPLKAFSASGVLRSEFNGQTLSTRAHGRELTAVRSFWRECQRR